MTLETAYSYRAARGDGGVERGIVEAGSREAVSALLTDRGLFPLDIEESSKGRVDRARMSAEDLATGLHMLATLLEAGLPIGRALSAMQELAPSAWSSGLLLVQDQIRQGASLATALRSSPLRIPSLVIGIVQAGEGGSGLATAVRRAGEVVERQAATRNAVRAALAYPVILAVAGTASISLLVGVVLPRFSEILSDLGQALPPTTRLVLIASNMLRVGILPGILVLAAGLWIWSRWTATPTGREIWHSWLLSLPVVGPIRLSAGSARASSALAALLDSGLPISPALQKAAPAAGDDAIATRLLLARDAILTGQSISYALSEARAMPVAAIRLIRTGEETGRLTELLYRAARLEDERVERRTRSAVRVIEPVLILIFGGLVALVAASLLQAVYSVSPGS